MNLGNRSLQAVLRAPLQGGHYRALAGMVLRYPDLGENLVRFLRGSGTYPYRCRIRTPVGTVEPLLYTSHDLSTVNEVFCREDYRAAPELRVAVDVGSNIGISALYFLTRNRTSHTYLYEPDPKNVARLRATLAGLEDRYRLEEVAASTFDGLAQFGVEPIGRYGTLLIDAPSHHPPTDVLEVRVRSLTGILEDVLRREPRIDLLKIDTEGNEIELVQSLPETLLERIDTIVYETDGAAPLHTDRFRFRYSCQTNRLTRRDSARAEDPARA